MLEGIVRDSISKQATKQLRRDGYLIANIYGKGLDNVNAAFKNNDYIRTLKAKDGLSFDVKVDGKKLPVVVKEYQVHPITGTLVHVDLQIATKGYVTNYLVPVSTSGEALGLKNKGLLHFAKKRIMLRGPIEAMPSSFNIDVTEMDVGAAKLIRDLEAPKGTKLMDADRVAVVGIIKAK